MYLPVDTGPDQCADLSKVVAVEERGVVLGGSSCEGRAEGGEMKGEGSAGDELKGLGD